MERRNDEFSVENFFYMPERTWGSVSDNGTMILQDNLPNLSLSSQITSYDVFNSVPHLTDFEASSSYFPLSNYTLSSHTSYPYDFNPIPNDTQGLTRSKFGEIPALVYSSEQVVDYDRESSGSLSQNELVQLKETYNVLSSPLKRENLDQTFSEQSNSKKRKMVSEKDVSLEVLQKYFSGSLKSAAKSIGVCPTTLKNICRKHGIKRWPCRKIKKIGDSMKKIQLALDSVEGVSRYISLDSFYTTFPQLSSPGSPSIHSHNGNSDFVSSTEAKQISSESLPPLPKRSQNVSENANAFKVEATLADRRIRFSMLQTWGFKELKKEIYKRFSIDDVSKINIKYLDDDNEWVVLMCDSDLEECLDLHKCASRRTIRIAIQFNNLQSSSRELLVYSF